MAVSSLGLQTWVSPLHIWHLLSGGCCHTSWEAGLFVSGGRLRAAAQAPAC